MLLQTVITVRPPPRDRPAAERRFAQVFAHLRLIRAYAARRGAHDAEAIAAEVMAVAWRRLADVPEDDPRPWLIATARNLLLADHRRHRQSFDDLDGVQIAAPEELPAPSLDLDPDLRPRCHACHHRTARRCYSAGNAIVKACLSTGRLTRHYTKAQLRAALASIPASVKQYTNCPNVIGHALLSAR
jgi:DNA-directed RNA polymerase specialized sigma24 family protein